jgi:HD-GYP domain-containing protein (c-di-GMP phosphodiesterase class II)
LSGWNDLPKQDDLGRTILHKPIKRFASNLELRLRTGGPRLVLQALSTALRVRDAETYEHSRRVVAFSLRLGQELSLDRSQLESLGLGAFLHDIGKIRVPDAILLKPGKLTAEEWVRMRNHPLYGQQLLKGIKFLTGASLVVGQHHEKWDGSGYPRRLAGGEIDLNARIFAVADAYDAMTTDRVYRAGASYENAAAELASGAGKHFDPMVVEVFQRIPQHQWEGLDRQRARAANALSSLYGDRRPSRLSGAGSFRFSAS